MKPVTWASITHGSRWLWILLVANLLVACSGAEDGEEAPVGGQKAITNNTPSVNAGPDQFKDRYVAEIELIGEYSDSQGRKRGVSVLWRQLSGPSSAQIDNPASSYTKVQIGAFTEDPALFIFELTATDSSGNSSSDEVQITIPKPSNTPPAANAGADRVAAAGDTVSITGSGEASNVGGTITAYQWTQVNNGAPAVVLDNANTTTVSFVAPSVENSATIVLLLTVTDNLGATASDQVSIQINATNSPPVVDLGGDRSVIAGSVVQITSNATDIDGEIVSYQWSQRTGPPVTLINNEPAVVSFNAPDVATTQTIILRVTVGDDDGATASDEVVITVLPPNGNQPPTVAAGNDRLVNAGQQVTVTAATTGSIATYRWSNATVNGPAITLDNAQTASVSFIAPQVSARTALTLRITVTDDADATASDEVVITINAQPIVNAGTDQVVNAGSVVTLNGIGSDVDGNIASYEWTQTGTPQVQLNDATTESASFTAPDVTQTIGLTFQLSVTDNDGATATDTINVTVNPQSSNNQPPIAQAGDDQAVNPGDTVILSGAGEDSDGSVAAYLWEHTPGQTQEPIVNITSPQTPSAEFTAPDVTETTMLTFTLTVTDDRGALSSDTVVVTVYPLARLSGAISVGSAVMSDSDVNDPATTPVPNDSSEQFQHIPNPAIVGGYVARAGIGPAGVSDNDVVDYYHVNMLRGQVVNVYLGESYFVFDETDPVVTQAKMSVVLMNEAGTPIYSNAGSSGILSLQVPNDQSVPQSANYGIMVQAGGGSAYSYVLTVGTDSVVQTEGWNLNDDFVPGELIVEFHDSSGIQSVTSPEQRAASVEMQALGGAAGRSMLLGFADAATKANAFAALGIVPSAVNDTLQAKIDTISAAVALKQRPDVKSVRLNYIYYPTAVPNDSLYARQWHYPLINLPQAWDTTTGSAEVTVAVLDTGILSNHPDIDANRLVDGYDFIRSRTNAGDGNGIDPNPEDPGDGGGVRASSFHGTHVAGTIGANTNNSIGVAGVAWQANIMPLRVLGLNGGTSYDIEQAIRYAAQLPNDSNTLPSRKADVINLSLGGPANSRTPPEAYRLARDAGVIIVAAAGNDGSNQMSAPASFDGVVSVSAVTINKQRASYSNFGSTIDVAAPGGNYSDTNGDGLADAVWSTKGSDAGNSIQFTYNYAAGTSMAAPHVAGVVALMKSVYPGLTPAIFDNMLARGDLTQDLGASGRDNNFGYGLIDAQKAVAAAVIAAGGTPTPVEPAVLAVTPSVLNFGSQMTVLEINVANSGAGTLAINDITEDSGGWLSIETVSVDAQQLGVYAVSVNRDGLAQGIYTATISVSSDAGTMDIPVSMQVFFMEVINDAGPQVVELIDINTQQAVQTLRVLPNNGVYDFSFDNVRLGTYHVRSSSDLDNDGTLCELGESCGAYPTLDNTVSSDIHVDGSNSDINGLNFETGFSINVIAQ